MKYVKIITVILLFIIFMAMRTACNSSNENKKPLTIQERELIKRDSLKKVREDKLDKALTVLKMQIKDNMKDPSSFEMMNRTWDSKDSLKDVVKLQIKFRGNNSFGGKTVSICNGTYNFKTDQVKISEVFTL